MGINLHRENFLGWLREHAPAENYQSAVLTLSGKLGPNFIPDHWTFTDDEYPRLGSYGAYDVFRHALFYVERGHFDDQIYGSDIEDGVRLLIEKTLRKSPNRIPYVKAILDAGDTDTIFIPTLFERPIQIGEDDEAAFISSSKGAIEALCYFSTHVGFDLFDFDDDIVEGHWRPLNTCKNITRIMYSFLLEQPGACVALK